MKVGFIISMYDEIETVKKTVDVLRQNKCPIIVIQSDPSDLSKVLESNLVDHYEKLADLAGSKEEYLKERSNLKDATTPVKAVTRNYSAGFVATKKFDVDWWVAILGDVTISNINGLQKIIQKMLQNNKFIGITRAVGQAFLDNDKKHNRTQNNDTTDFMPQFFIVKDDLVKQGLFTKIDITNLYTTEQCMGDEVNRFCSEKNLNFNDIVHVISDYAYPQFIEGLHYNKDRIKMPKYVDGFVNFLRRFRVRLSI